MADRFLTLKLAATDLNAVLAKVAPVQVTFVDGGFNVCHSLPLVTLTARIHLDLGAGRLRLAIPFAEIRAVRGPGWLVRQTLKMVWGWLDSRLEERIGNLLGTHGLPWDLVWIDGYRDAKGGKVATLNISPTVLNEWLVKQPLPGGLAARLAGVEVESNALVLKLQLLPPAASHRAFPSAAPDADPRSS